MMKLAIPSDRYELTHLEDWAEANESGRDYDLGELIETYRLYYENSLAGFCRGDGDNKDMQKLIVWHWPHLMVKNPEMPVDWWQCRIIRHILSGRETDMQEVVIKGCTKAGKGFSAAASGCLWFQSKADSCKVIVNSATADHAKKVMFAEIVGMRKVMRFPCAGRDGKELVSTPSENKYMSIANPLSGEGFSGQHSDATLFIFDEATGTAKEYWELAETQAHMQVALANPREAVGWFRASFPSGDPDKSQVIELSGGGGRRSLHTIGGQDCINVKRGRTIIQGQIDAARYKRIASKGGRWKMIFGDGKFPTESGESVLIAIEWLEHHVRAYRKDSLVRAFGLDVAASIAGDRSVLTAGGPSGMRKQLEIQEVDTMIVVGWVLRSAMHQYGIDLKLGQTPITVDMDGLGKGTGDRLREQGCLVLEFRGNAPAEEDPKTHANLRAEGYALFGLRLNPKGAWGDDTFGLPNDIELHQEMCAPGKLFGSDGIRFHITPKKKPNKQYKGDTIQEMLGRSPDKGDSAVYCAHAIRYYERVSSWDDSWRGELIASGEDPEKEQEKLTDEDIEDLDDDLADIILNMREYHGTERDWDD